MAVVDYSDSETDSEDGRAKKKIKTSELPSLPSTFLDLYSSTVRSSTHDDPSLHGGRTRVVPHIVGNWPAHVYLEWHPDGEQLQTLSAMVAHADQAKGIQSLLCNDLGVTLPLHISLSRPLVLRTEQKDNFLDNVRRSIQASSVGMFSVQAKNLRWHPNEVGSRQFLVLQLNQPDKDELSVLLERCNKVAAEYQQPLLYSPSETSQQSADKPQDSSQVHRLTGQFHISLAWALALPASQTGQYDVTMPTQLAEKLATLQISLSEVKVRIGQDVTSIALAQQRQGRKSLFL